MGDRASSSVGPVYGLSRRARPHAIKGSLDRRLQRKIRALVDAFPGTSGVYVQDLRTGKGAAWNARARFMGASTLKLGIAIEVLRVLGGKPPADSRVGSFFRRMLVYSDNGGPKRSRGLARWRLDLPGSARVTATMRALGLYDTYINGGYILGTADRVPIPLNVVEQPSYYSTGKYTSAWDLARIHTFLHRGAVGTGPCSASPAGSRPVMRASCSGRWRTSRSREARPLHRGEPGVSVLHKAGWISVARHDSGLVYWNGGGLVAVVMTYSSSGVGASSDILAGKIAEARTRPLLATTLSRRGAMGRLFFL
jgi:hypothetical protein